MTARRIVSLLPGATESLFALGVGDRVVGVSHECDFPPEVADKPRVTRCRLDGSRSSREIDQAVRSRADGGLPLYELDAPRLVSLAPDLIVTQSQCDVCAVSHDDVLRSLTVHASLREAKVLPIDCRSLDDLLADVARIGDAVGAPIPADRLRRSLLGRLDAVRTAAADVPSSRRPRVVCIEWTDPIMLAANWVPELVRAAGGVNGLTRAGETSRYWPWEDIVRYDPDVLIVSPCGFDLERSTRETQQLSRRASWRDLRAVASGQVYVLDGNAYLTRGGPRLVDTVEILGHLLFPDRVPARRNATARAAAWRRFGAR